MIMIGSKAHLGFIPFIYNLSPVIIVVLIAFIISIKFIFGRKMVVREELRQKLMAMDENKSIKDPVLLRKSLVVLAITIAGFVAHGALNLELATIALTGACILLLVSGMKDPRHVLAEAEWGTIFFIIGLFIIIGAVVKVGLIKWMAIKVLDLSHGNFFGMSMIVMWFSAFASAFIDNIPFVATMNPLIINMAQQLWPDLTGVETLLHHPDLMPL